VPPPEEREASAYFTQATKQELARDPMFATIMAMEVAEGGKRAALELKLQALDLAFERDFKGAVRLFRRAAEQDPCSAEIHFRLGACLWQDGDIDGGLEELEIAGQLDPGWDRPPVEIANVLLNIGRDDEALRRLEAARPHLQEPSPWHLLHLAFVNEWVGKADRAAEVYEELVRLDEDHGEALDRLAHLRFLQPDKRQGAALAKRAAHLGFTDVFNAWEAGYYNGKLPSERPPRTTPEYLRQLRLHRVRTKGRAQGARVGRNEPCPCGSGKEFEKCHGNS
jgi:tetratricopeptide (TPR) repeat protein